LARYPNFDCLRVGAAISVLFSHAFLIAEGSQQNEPLIRLTGNQGILGLLGVFVFFIMSGFLVTQSFEAGRSPARFISARLLRILPGLAVCLVICVLLIGATVTRLPFTDYVTHPGTRRFLIDNLLFQDFDQSLPGVLFSNNPVGPVVGGSFWSLRYELYFYIMVLALGVARLLNLRVSLFLFCGGLAASYFDQLGGFGWLLPFFAAGMTLYYLGRVAPPTAGFAIAAALGIVASAYFGQLLFAFSLFGGYLTIYLATSSRVRLPRAARFGDLSYGIYIYGWPVEECVAYTIGDTVTWWQVFLLGLGTCLPLAFLSWHCIEKNALRLKPGRSAPLLETQRADKPAPAAV
jgi:peptidoglycan/LPS O-acetylase OafA/YrhL